jgi:ABC transporter C-terminal domain
MIQNHLDLECVEALGEALSNWPVDDGAIVVVSHDRNFCDQIEFTHVATFQDGSFKLEQRGTRDSDWVIEGLWADVDAETNCAPGQEQGAPAKKELDPKLRKMAFNAPKRIAKLEQLLAKAEARIAELDQKMLSNGSDVGMLVNLSKERSDLETKVESYMAEWAQLDEILSQVAAAAS